jgi:hypothetical protein
MGIVVLVAFIFALSRLWTARGAGTPIKFIIAWVLGLLGFSALGLAPGFFQAYQALLAIIAWFLAKART